MNTLNKYKEIPTNKWGLNVDLNEVERGYYDNLLNEVYKEVMNKNLDSLAVIILAARCKRRDIVEKYISSFTSSGYLKEDVKSECIRLAEKEYLYYTNKFNKEVI